MQLKLHLQCVYTSSTEKLAQWSVVRDCFYLLHRLLHTQYHILALTHLPDDFQWQYVHAQSQFLISKFFNLQMQIILAGTVLRTILIYIF